MRIIAGDYRGKQILPPPGRTTRPITDRVKESLFAILGQRTCGAVVADIFAGTGSLGLEALSRQAQSCLFVEKDRPALRLLRQNIQDLGVKDKVQIANKNAWHFSKWVRLHQPFSLIFLDPPYLDSRNSGQSSQLAELLVGLAQPHLLDKNGIVILRHESAYPCQERYSRLVLTDFRRYGPMALSFLAPSEASASETETTPLS